MHCTGNETSLSDCFGSDATSSLPVGEVTCNSQAGVICEGISELIFGSNHNLYLYQICRFY